jgi:hypothetical protein
MILHNNSSIYFDAMVPNSDIAQSTQQSQSTQTLANSCYQARIVCKFKQFFRSRKVKTP